MRKILNLLLHTIIVLVLTMLTQIGGVVYIVSLLYFDRFKVNRRARLAKLGNFIGLYLLVTFLIVPFIAPVFGRVALPLTGNVKPLTYLTCILNRHYVKQDLRSLATNTAEDMKLIDSTTELYYLDANFPFFNGFPLLPHLSHNDGKKLDLALYFKKDGKKVDYAMSTIGYGGAAEPYKEEANNKSAECEKRGYWQYSLLHDLLPEFLKNDVEFDEDRTRMLIELLLKQPKLEKLFIEPHLVTRMRLNNSKIRYHGCHAVRHDDHIHVQIK